MDLNRQIALRHIAGALAGSMAGAMLAALVPWLLFRRSPALTGEDWLRNLVVMFTVAVVGAAIGLVAGFRVASRGAKGGDWSER